MFSSSGFFADIDCPFSKRGLCERPHCLYRHVTKTPDVLDTCCISSLTDSAGQCLNQSSELSVKQQQQQQYPIYFFFILLNFVFK